MNYRLTLGLEIHIQVNSAKKMFCGCSADIWQAEPNTRVCPTCLGLPGALPVPNFESIQKTQLLGLALNCRLNKNSHFDRKHYFYPDLPKGYQISQYKEPLCAEGFLDLKSGKRAAIERIHLEEDTAKSFHEGGRTLIDFNKSGVSLIEIVTKPCFNDIADAVDFCKKIQDIARVVGVSEADMERGNMRLEANVSLRTLEMEQNDELAGYKVEVKNINSFRFMEKAVLYEIKRQSDLLDAGQKLKQENRGWDERKGVTVPQRDKEEAHDYRYFPDPDIPPMEFTEKYFKDLKSKLPELPHQLKSRLIEKYGVNIASAEFFTTGAGLELTKRFEEIINTLPKEQREERSQKVANLLINKPECRNLSINDFINGLTGPVDTPGVSAKTLEELVKKVLVDNPSAVQNYKAGKISSFEFLLGQVVRSLKTKADVKLLREILTNQLKQS